MFGGLINSIFSPLTEHSEQWHSEFLVEGRRIVIWFCFLEQLNLGEINIKILNNNKTTFTNSYMIY